MASSRSKAGFYVHRICYKDSLSNFPPNIAVRCLFHMHSLAKYSPSPAAVEDERNKGKVNDCTVQRVSLAKHLAILPEESSDAVKTKASWKKTNVLKDEKYRNNYKFEHVKNVVSCTDSSSDDDRCEVNYHPPSLAKRLACLTDESSTPTKRKARTRMELKRAIELRIKKRVKQVCLNGKFYHLVDKVVANADTLLDSYDILRLNSNVDLASERDNICFISLAEQLKSGEFDIHINTTSFYGKNVGKEFLVLPNLKLRIIQEAIRVVLEVIYRPHFSKISYGCRSGRGRQPALRYICHEIGKTDWWFTLHMKKRADKNLMSKLMDTLGEMIEDNRLFSIIQCMFDAQVLNLEFGVFPKGQGHPQEGILSPILMNIYLHNLDAEVFRLFMRYEGFGSDPSSTKGSSLRRWFRRQTNESDAQRVKEDSDLRLHACRYMDELIIAVSGSREIATSLKNEIQEYLKCSLYIDVDGHSSIMAVNSSSMWQFCGTLIRHSAKECDAVRIVHKLKDKINSFAAQKQEIWNAGMVRIGKKWLAHGLKRIKESEIKQLGLSSPMLDKISRFRKEGMKTDHWFKCLLQIWLQDVNSRAEFCEEAVLSKYIAEPAVPQDLKDSFYNFQKHVNQYVSSESASTLALQSSSSVNAEYIMKMEAPISIIQQKLVYYGVISKTGYPRHVSTLLLQDDSLIICWFSGLVQRWLKWYSGYENFKDVKLLMVEYIKTSCIRTLAAKHRMQESLIEKQFDLELNTIPLTEDLEIDVASLASSSTSTAYEEDEALMYGISYSGLCMLSLAKIEAPSHNLKCFAIGCPVRCPKVYTLHIKEHQKFPGLNTGLSAAIHLCLSGEKVVLCNQHVRDLYLGHISLQAIEFGNLRR